MSAADIIPPDAWPAPQCSPDVAADGRVTFRLRAPRAAEVVLNGQWPTGRAALAKDEQGVWSATVGPVPAGIWEYGLSWTAS